MKGKDCCTTLYLQLLLAAISFVPLISTGAHASTQEMTVEDAIRLGLKNNYDIQIARNEAEIAINNKVALE